MLGFLIGLKKICDEYNKELLNPQSVQVLGKNQEINLMHY